MHDHRLGDTERIDAVAQGGDVLLDRVVGNLLDALRLDLGDQAWRAANRRAAGNDQVGGIATDGQGDHIEIFAAAGLHDDALRAATDLDVADVLVACQRADVIDIALFLDIEHALLVDLHEEVHATLQIEAERHRVGTDRAQPGGYGRSEVQGDGESVTEVAAQRTGRSQLRIGVREGHQQALVLDDDFVEGDLSRLQGLQGTFLHGFVNDAALVGQDLHGRLFLIQRRYCVQDAQQRHGGDQEVFPAGKIVHSYKSSSTLLPIDWWITCSASGPL